MSFITKKLEELKNYFSSGINANGIHYIPGEEVKAFLSTAIDEMINEVEKGLPEEASDGIYGNYKDGFDDCLEKVKQSLSSLREGNK